MLAYHSYQVPLSTGARRISRRSGTLHQVDIENFDVGVLLRRARRIARVSQRELADRAGVPNATVARIESGRTENPRVQTVAAILAAMDCRLALVSSHGVELAEHPWEQQRDYGDRHFPAHLDLVPVNHPWGLADNDWWGWYRGWAWERGAPVPLMTFVRIRNAYYCPPLEPGTGEPT